jgi:hypothetical protein
MEHDHDVAIEVVCGKGLRVHLVGLPARGVGREESEFPVPGDYVPWRRSIPRAH